MITDDALTRKEAEKDEIVPLTLGTRVYDRLGNRWLWLKHRTPDGGIEYQCERPYFQSRPRPGGWVFGGTLTTEGIKWLSLTNSSDQALSLESVREDKEAIGASELIAELEKLGIPANEWDGDEGTWSTLARCIKSYCEEQAHYHAEGLKLDRESVREEVRHAALEAAAKVCDNLVGGRSHSGDAIAERLATAIRTLQHAPARVAEGDALLWNPEVDHPQTFRLRGRYWTIVAGRAEEPSASDPRTGMFSGFIPPAPSAPESPAKEQPGEQDVALSASRTKMAEVIAWHESQVERCERLGAYNAANTHRTCIEHYKKLGYS